MAAVSRVRPSVNMLKAAEFQGLAEVPPAAEWSANLDNANTALFRGNEVIKRWQRLKITAVTAMLMACPAHSAEWVLLNFDEGYYIDASSIRSDIQRMRDGGDFRTANFRHVFKPRRAGAWYIKESNMLIAFDCEGHRNRIDAMSTTSSDGVIEPELVSAPVLWDPVPSGDTAFEFVCTRPRPVH